MSNYKIGYARVSTVDQDEALQLDALQRACADRIFVDRASGSIQDRPGLLSALECARSGAVNTYEHHEGVVRGERAERNGLKTINGDFGRLDRTTWKTLNAILERPLPALTA